MINELGMNGYLPEGLDGRVLPAVVTLLRATNFLSQFRVWARNLHLRLWHEEHLFVGLFVNAALLIITRLIIIGHCHLKVVDVKFSRPIRILFC